MVESLRIVLATLRAAGVDVVLEAATARMLSQPDGASREVIGQGVDVVARIARSEFRLYPVGYLLYDVRVNIEPRSP